MKIRLVKYLLLLQIGLILPGCEKDLKNDNLPPFEQKLSIASFISPSDTGTFVFVSSNRRLYGELGVDELTGNLSGTISDGSQEFELDTAKFGLYISSESFPVQYGETYTLKITSDKGLSAYASCTVPAKREFIVVADTFSTPSYAPQGYRRTINISLEINDIPGEENYYRIRGEGIGYRKDLNGEVQLQYPLNLSFPEDLFSDKGNDGKSIVIKSHSGMSYYFDFDSSFVKICLYSLEKSYYLYHKSLDDYNSGENPFAEVTPVYSNVSGGLGIFTSYTVDTLIYRIK